MKNTRNNYKILNFQEIDESRFFRSYFLNGGGKKDKKSQLSINV